MEVIKTTEIWMAENLHIPSNFHQMAQKADNHPGKYSKTNATSALVDFYIFHTISCNHIYILYLHILFRWSGFSEAYAS